MDNDDAVKRMKKQLQEEQEKLLAEIKEKSQNSKTKSKPKIDFRIKRN